MGLKNKTIIAFFALASHGGVPISPTDGIKSSLDLALISIIAGSTVSHMWMWSLEGFLPMQAKICLTAVCAIPLLITFFLDARVIGEDTSSYRCHLFKKIALLAIMSGFFVGYNFLVKGTRSLLPLLILDVLVAILFIVRAITKSSGINMEKLSGDGLSYFYVTEAALLLATGIISICCKKKIALFIITLALMLFSFVTLCFFMSARYSQSTVTSAILNTQRDCMKISRIFVFLQNPYLNIDEMNESQLRRCLQELSRDKLPKTLLKARIKAIIFEIDSIIGTIQSRVPNIDINPRGELSEERINQYFLRRRAAISFKNMSFFLKEFEKAKPLTEKEEELMQKLSSSLKKLIESLQACAFSEFNILYIIEGKIAPAFSKLVFEARKNERGFVYQVGDIEAPRYGAGSLGAGTSNRTSIVPGDVSDFVLESCYCEFEPFPARSVEFFRNIHSYKLKIELVAEWCKDADVLKREAGVVAAGAVDGASASGALQPPPPPPEQGGELRGLQGEQGFLDGAHVVD